MVTYTVLGVVTDPSYYHCESLAKRIAENSSDVRVETFLSFEVEFWERVDEYKNKIDSTLMHYRSTHLVLCDQTIIGDVEAFTSYVSSRFDYAVDAEVANTVIYNRNVREGFYNLLKNHENPIVYIQFGLQDTKKVNDYDPMGGVYIELFSKLCPKASENFIKLCEGGKGSNRYTGCTINRLVRNGWLQTGDVVDNTGKNSVAVEGDTVPDECFQVDFGQWRGGVVGYANEGAHTNRSQFFITLGACPWMNHKFVGFGRVIQGYSILRRINDISTNNQVPVRAVKILECGSPPELKA